MASQIEELSFSVNGDVLNTAGLQTATFSGNIFVNYSTNPTNPSISSNSSISIYEGGALPVDTITGLSISYSGGMYTITGSGTASTFSFQYTGTAPSFVTNVKYAPVGASVQTAASDPVSSSAVCFAEGTLIATERGQVPVEALAIGDMVVTASRELRPVRWLGHRVVHCRKHADPGMVMPVRIGAHAFGRDRPARDLLLSPGHSICVDVVTDVLIPAFVLVNGATIQQTDVDTVTYWHVELDSHDVIMAENLACESFLDMGNRGFFAESGIVDLAAAPDTVWPTHDDFCRPFRIEGVLVDAVREALCGRASDLGWRLAVEDALGGLYLEVDGTRIEPARRGMVARAYVPATAREVRIRSTSAAPAELHGAKDTRKLGLQVASVTIDDGLGIQREIGCGDPRLVDGFHPHEGTLRWTDGNARLPAELWEGCEDTFVLRLAFAGPALPRWIAPQEHRAARIAPERPAPKAAKKTRAAAAAPRVKRTAPARRRTTNSPAALRRG